MWTYVPFHSSAWVSNIPSGINLILLQVLKSPFLQVGCSAVLDAMYHFNRLNAGQTQLQSFVQSISFIQISTLSLWYYYCWEIFICKLKAQTGLNLSKSHHFMFRSSQTWIMTSQSQFCCFSHILFSFTRELIVKNLVFNVLSLYNGRQSRAHTFSFEFRLQNHISFGV